MGGKFDVCAVGHITKDIIRIGKSVKRMPGGVVYYFSIAASSLGLKTCAITKLSKKDRLLLKDLIESGVSVFWKHSDRTTVFENIYPTSSPDFRIQRVKSIAQSFSVQDIAPINTSIFHLGPLTENEIPLEVLKSLSKKAKISLDVQGYLRKAIKGRIEIVNWEGKEEGLSCVDILKTNEEEVRALSGEEDIKRAAKKLAKYGPEEVIVTLGSKGSLIYHDGRFYSIPAFPVKKVTDPTGCGDSYMAGYIFKRLKSDNLDEVGRFAAATASLKLERFGPFRESSKSVINYLRF